MEDEKLVDYTVIDCHNEKDINARIGMMLLHVSGYLDGIENIDKIVMEESILKSNVQTVKQLSFLMGGIMFYAQQKGIKFQSVLPTQWRTKVHIKQNNKIKRSELKEEAVRAVSQEYGITVSDDAAESILIAKSGFIMDNGG
jgi:Holliday junction resolvasome RuvABC endonuclease subunit